MRDDERPRLAAIVLAIMPPPTRAPQGTPIALAVPIVAAARPLAEGDWLGHPKGLAVLS
jgi:hypothetical protein